MDIVIVGGGLAGSRTAQRLRRAGFDGTVTLVGGEPHAAYDRPPLSKQVLTQEDEPAEPPYLRADADVELLSGVHATALRSSGHRVLLDDGTTLGYDRLVIATGMRPRRLFDGRRGVHVLRTWSDGLALRAALREAKRVVVIGGGVLGCEIAASARALDLDVTVVELLEQPLVTALGPAIGSVIADLHRSRGVDVRCSTRVARLEGANDRVERVVLADGTALDADLVVVAAGAIPNTEWLSGSAVRVDDGVLVDRFGATSAINVFAAGDVARFPHPWAQGTVRPEHWQTAGDTAALVARNVLAEPADRVPLTAVPYFWTDQYQSKFQVIGLPSADDELTVLDGALDGRFAGHYTRDGVLTGLVTVGMPAVIAPYRKRVGTPL
ncbi:NAD(P)/FAD-dependent oxidoreductase [Actinophytocola oryzae]|uniref:NAD/ferredoxin-dependent reductase-like protein n=1 Tax=Actinophytocola oryzae TaxID=502181 RepID=A0A4R7VXK8_9PSEU|nr:FAD/NAD(P)-binding oxidoreductase [Actinophytocola oryzae]TDV54870.1 NAD/ferredoxin-dependent reductase-like protein [Actinophytocola oryzae]